MVIPVCSILFHLRYTAGSNFSTKKNAPEHSTVLQIRPFTANLSLAYFQKVWYYLFIDENNFHLSNILNFFCSRLGILFISLLL